MGLVPGTQRDLGRRPTGHQPRPLLHRSGLPRAKHHPDLRSPATRSRPLRREPARLSRLGEAAHRRTGCGLLLRPSYPSSPRSAPRRAPAPVLALPGNRPNRYLAAELALNLPNHRQDAARTGTALSPLWDELPPLEPTRKPGPPVQLTALDPAPTRAALSPPTLPTGHRALGRPRLGPAHPTTPCPCPAQPPST